MYHARYEGRPGPCPITWSGVGTLGMEEVEEQDQEEEDVETPWMMDVAEGTGGAEAGEAATAAEDAAAAVVATPTTSPTTTTGAASVLRGGEAGEGEREGDW